jgi:hypothetical protein
MAILRHRREINDISTQVLYLLVGFRLVDISGSILFAPDMYQPGGHYTQQFRISIDMLALGID